MGRRKRDDFDAAEYWQSRPYCTVCNIRKTRSGSVCHECRRDQEAERKRRLRVRETKATASASCQSESAPTSNRERTNQQIRAELVRIAEAIYEREGNAKRLTERRSELEPHQYTAEQETAGCVAFFAWVLPLGALVFAFLAAVHPVALIVAIALILVWGNSVYREKQAREQERGELSKRLSLVRDEIEGLHGQFGKAKRDLRRPTISDKLRELIWLRDGKTCYLCGNDIPNFDGNSMHVDHLKPFSKGGTNEPENLRATHPACNLKKQDNIVRPGTEDT